MELVFTTKILKEKKNRAGFSLKVKASPGFHADYLKNYDVKFI
jgi:hypothetical protein